MTHEPGHTEPTTAEDLLSQIPEDATLEDIGGFVLNSIQGQQSAPDQEFIGVVPGAPPARRAARPRTDPTGAAYGFVEVEPRFTLADVDAPARRSVEQIRRLQIRMNQVPGLLPRNVTLGVWDDPSRAAYQKVLEVANRQGFTKDADALDFIARQAEATGAEGFGLPEAQLPAPETIRAGVNEVMIRELGRRLQPDETEAIVNAYQGVVQSRIRSNVAPPQLDVFVEEQIESGEHGVEAGAFEMATRVQDFFGQLDSPIEVAPAQGTVN